MLKAKRYIAWGILVFPLFIYVYKNRSVFLDMLSIAMISILLTAVLSPLCDAAEKRGMKPAAAAAFSLLILFCAVFLFASAFIPYLAVQGMDLIRRCLPALSNLSNRLSSVTEQSGYAFLNNAGMPKMIADSIARFTSSVTSFGFSAASKVGIFGFSLIIVYHLLKERRLLYNHMMLFVPSEWRSVFLAALQSCTNSIKGYLSAMIKTSLIVSGMTCLALLIFEVPNAFLLSLLMGLLEILPYIGPVLASVPILLSCLPMGMNTALVVLIVLILIQQVEGNLISPYLTAESTSIHPLAALISVFFFGRLLGITGIFFAIPIVMVARCIFFSFEQARNLMKA